MRYTIFQAGRCILNPCYMARQLEGWHPLDPFVVIINCYIETYKLIL